MLNKEEFSTRLGASAPYKLRSPTPDNASCTRKVNIKLNFIRFVFERSKEKKMRVVFIYLYYALNNNNFYRNGLSDFFQKALLCNVFSLKEKYFSYLNLE